MAHSRKNDGNLAIAEGDLNQDGLMDKAFVIEGKISKRKKNTMFRQGLC